MLSSCSGGRLRGADPDGPPVRVLSLPSLPLFKPRCSSSLRIEATAFGRATLEGSADAARFFRIVTRPALSPPWRTRPLEPTRWRHRNPSGRRATGIDGRADLVRPSGLTSQGAGLGRGSRRAGERPAEAQPQRWRSRGGFVGGIRTLLSLPVPGLASSPTGASCCRSGSGAAPGRRLPRATTGCASSPAAARPCS